MIAILSILSPHLTGRTLKQMTLIIDALLSMTSRVTMLGLSRWTEKGIRTRVYQVKVWHKHFPELLNVVIIVKTNLTTGRTAKVLLFSDDLTLASETIIDYYSLEYENTRFAL